MDDGIDLVRGKHRAQPGLVAYIHLIFREIAPGQLTHTAQRLGAGVVVVVHHNDIIAGIQQFQTGMASDISGATCY